MTHGQAESYGSSAFAGQDVVIDETARRLRPLLPYQRLAASSVCAAPAR